MKFEVLPALIAKDQLELNSICNKLTPYFDSFHLDIMDGKFVENKSMDFEEFVLPPNKNYEAHLMLDKPDNWARKKINNLDAIILNFERIRDKDSIIDFIQKKGQKIGFALNPETGISHLFPYLKKLDLVLLLAVNPGKYGSLFQPSIYDKIYALRAIYEGDIEVDGGMNPMTIGFCKDSGANRFAVGSYLQNSNDLAVAAKQLLSALK